MSKEEVIAKVRKLLALSRSDNENEAALALARAQSLMERHDIEEASLAEAAPEEIEEAEFAAEDGRSYVHWRFSLAGVVAKARGCSLFGTKNGGKASYRIVGRRSDVDTARMLFDFCASEINRLVASNARGRGRAFANAYRHGCVAAIRKAVRDEAERLRAEMAPRYGTSALVVVDRYKAADAWANERHKLGASRGGEFSDGGGYSAGRRDGAGIYGGRNRVGAGKYLK